MGVLLAYLFLALIVSFLCSLTESVLLSTPQTYLTTIKEKENWANSFLDLKSNIDKPLSAILSLNTIAHTIGAAGVGAQAVKIWGDTSLGLVSVILTILILVITEIIPKTMGARYWRTLSKVTYHIIKIMLFLTYPLVIFSTKIMDIISKEKKEDTTSREEIAALANIGVDEGVFSEKENKIIQNILKLQKIKVTQIMTPRVVVKSVDENISLEDFKNQSKYLNFSRIPTFSIQNEKITGYILLQDILEELSKKEKNNLLIKSFKREVLKIPNNVTLLNLWDQLVENKEHIAIVLDEYGGLDGVVTMEDVVETLLGLEITDENDEIVDMQEYAKERWKKRQKKENILSEFRN
ncbi:MAG: hemolysin [Flavobacteriales bacterium]|nr:hemolysin [Flavobacteriales bacterium]|tara:strand:+ start:1368 stop:2423 length:1056 start_codon:yes stop_codon:yes gene_type:complete